MPTQNFGRLVREKRERLGLTIREAAELCGLSERGLELIELGDSDPKLSSVLRIASVLQIDLGEISSSLPLLQFI
jgi:transcriptional regulator with XRE-family HTH domain